MSVLYTLKFGVTVLCPLRFAKCVRQFWICSKPVVDLHRTIVYSSSPVWFCFVHYTSIICAFCFVFWYSLVNVISTQQTETKQSPVTSVNVHFLYSYHSAYMFCVRWFFMPKQQQTGIFFISVSVRYLNPGRCDWAFREANKYLEQTSAEGMMPAYDSVRMYARR